MLLQKVDAMFKTIWLHRATGRTLLWATIIACGIPLFWPQPVGYAATVLAAGAGIMSFREMPYTQKVLMALAIGFLMIIELNDIHQDKIKHDAQVTQDRIDEDNRFAKLLDVQQKSFEKVLNQNQEEFSATIVKINTLVDANKNLGIIAKQSLDKLNERSGGLVPANIPSPVVEVCPGTDVYQALYYGSGVSVGFAYPHPVVKIHGKTWLVIDRDSSQSIFITGTILDDKGDLVVKIEHNKFLATYAASYVLKTKSRIEVYDRHGDRILDVNFLNPLAIQISADVRSPDGAEVYFDETQIKKGKSNNMVTMNVSGNCNIGMSSEGGLELP